MAVGVIQPFEIIDFHQGVGEVGVRARASACVFLEDRCKHLAVQQSTEVVRVG